MKTGQVSSSPFMEKFIFTRSPVDALKRELAKFAVTSKVLLPSTSENQYLPGEECTAICEADNYKCETAINEVKVKFVKCVTLMSGLGEERSFYEEISNISFAGVGAHNMYTGENSQKLSLPLRYRNSDTPIHPSTSGRYVKCEYHIKVTPVVSGCCVKNE